MPANTTPGARRFAIAGVGLIGGSIALRARAAGAHVTGYDADPAAVEAAVAAGVLDAAAASLAEVVDAADVVVLAAPLDATLAHLAALRAAPPERAALIVDVASVKVQVAAAAGGLVRFAGTHPIAGSELSGVAAARADLFEGKTWMYDADTADETTGRVRDFIAAMGGRPLGMSPPDHDRLVALTSHLPQLLSTLLGDHVAAAADDPAARALCGTGLASMLRLGRSSWPVWEPILAANRLPLAQEVRALAAVLIDAAGRLESGGIASFAENFAAARAVAAALAGPEPSPEQRPTR